MVGILSLTLTLIGVYVAYLQLKRTPKQPINQQGEKATEKIDKYNASTNTDDLVVTKVKNNLPPRSAFIGRDKEKLRVFEGLTSAYPLVAIEGLGGMGKTSLAKEIAWSCVEKSKEQGEGIIPSFDSIVWVQDQDGKLTLNEILDTIARVLGYSYILHLPSDEKRLEINKQLQETPCLIIVDNFETIDDIAIVDFVTRVPEPPSKVLITSRERLLRGAWAISIGKMEKEDAFALIRSEGKRLGLAALENADIGKLSALYEATGGNPLAIRLATGQIKDAGFSLDEVLKRLILADEGEIFSTMFERNWNYLLAGDDYSKRVLMAMTFFSTSASKEAIEAGSDVHHAYLRSAIKRLIELSLVDVSGELDEKLQRFQLHTLTKAFVRKEMEKVHEIGAAINERLIDYFLQCAEAWSDTYVDFRNVDRIEFERINLLEFAAAAYYLVIKHNNPHYCKIVVRYSQAMSAFLWGRGYWNDKIQLCERAVEAATLLGDNIALGKQLSLIGRTHLWRGNISAAQEYANKSKNAMKSIGDPKYMYIPIRLEAQIATQMGEYDIAELLLNDILQFAESSPDDDGRAATLIELGIVAERQAKFEIARERFAEALQIDEQFGTLEGQAVSLSHLANVAFSSGDNALAKQLFERGLTLAMSVDRLSTVGRCQIGLARIHIYSHNFQEAAILATAAKESFHRLGINEMTEESSQIASYAISELNKNINEV